jgi:hypothetical protein
MGSVCSPGITTCETATQLRTCNADGAGWTVTPCAADETCLILEGEALCSPAQPPCVLGQVQCGNAINSAADQATQFSRCEPVAAALFGQDWVVHACTIPLSCDPAAPGCSSDCTPGASRCSGDGVETCGADGAWANDVQSCTGDAVCTTRIPSTGGAVCADVACAELAAQAELSEAVSYREDGVCEGGQILRCDDQGTLLDAVVCAAGECSVGGDPYSTLAFNLGTCDSGRDCEPGSQRCVAEANSAYQVCDASGRWDPSYQVCATGACVEYLDASGLPIVRCGGECSPGQTSCNAESEAEGIRTCRDDGTWSATVPCASGACQQPPGYTEAVCIDECLPDETICLGGAKPASDGNAQGTMYAAVCDNGRIPGLAEATQCPDTLTCRTSAIGLTLGCVECVGPNVDGGNEIGLIDTRCSADAAGIETCGSDNDWGSPTGCLTTETCVPDGPVAVCTPNLVYGFEQELGAEWSTPAPAYPDDSPWAESTGLGSVTPFSGTQMLTSADIGDGGTASIALTLRFPAPGTISFVSRVSSEEGWDLLNFLIDWTQVDSESGAGDWRTQTYEVDAGTHVFAWRYVKNLTLTANEDAGFLDQVEVFGGVVP